MRISDWSSDVCSSDLASYPSPTRGEGKTGGVLWASPFFRGGAMLADLKAWLRIGSDDEDGVLERLLGSASGLCEQFIGQWLVVREIGRASCRERVCQCV